MVHRMFPINGKGEKSAISFHISKSGSSTEEALDREMEGKPQEISVKIVVTV